MMMIHIMMRCMTMRTKMTLVHLVITANDEVGARVVIAVVAAEKAGPAAAAIAAGLV